ncbi:MAG: T9SS type A sorting domain-containing protein [Lentimicrobiaceae bacterium]|nr:T9SS type A sorting domain-containing protein [Lentimicrobiaceae bacterium]
MKSTNILKTKISRLTNVMLLLVCSLYGLSVAAQNNFEFKKPTKKSANTELKKFVEKKSHAANKINSYTNWWEPDTIYTYEDPNMMHRELRSYNQNAYMLTEVYQEWRNNEWTDLNKNINTYDANNNLITELWQDWMNNNWVNTEKYTFTYDANNNMLTRLCQGWNIDAWVDFAKTTYTYDANNNMLTELIQFWEGAWVNYEKITNTYDANNNVLSILFQLWENNTWINDYIITATYDANNNLITAISQEWGYNAWENVEKIDATYDVNNNMLTLLYQEWAYNAWVNYEKHIYTYDANNNRTRELVQAWEGAWVNDFNYTYTYDENNNCTLAESSYWMGDNWQQTNGDLSLFYNNMKSEIYFFCYKITATYKHFLLLENERKELSNISIYPNPANNSFVVDVEGETTVKLHNMLGKEVLSQNANGKTVINIGHLPNGVYNVQVFSGDKIIGYSKVVKQ